MAKLIDLTGATVHINENWKQFPLELCVELQGNIIANENLIPFNIICFNGHIIGDTSNTDGYIYIKVYNGTTYLITLYQDMSAHFQITGGELARNKMIIDWVLENGSVEGGIWEQEHTVQIINPQMYILPPTKVVGNDLVVSAEEVVVNEAKTSFNVVVNLETDPVGTQHYIYYLHINGEYVNNINVAGSSTTLPKIEGSTSKSFNDVTTIAVNLALADSSYNIVKYKIDDGEQQTSSDPITITKDCTITFYIPWGD